MITVRRALLEDADAMCDAHVAAWRVAYRGLFPDEYLDSNEFETSRRDGWRRARWIENGTAMFAGLRDDEVVGFGHVGQSDGQDSSIGEVFGFYVHPDAWGTGVADKLMMARNDQLQSMGFERAVLWVLRDNPRARNFYERHGWMPSGRDGMWEGPQMPGTRGPSFVPVAEVEYGCMLG